jgi:hypothetical protein
MLDTLCIPGGLSKYRRGPIVCYVSQYEHFHPIDVPRAPLLYGSSTLKLVHVVVFCIEIKLMCCPLIYLTQYMHAS